MDKSKRDLLEGPFYAWLEANGVVFEEPIGKPPFRCTIDLNILKAAVLGLLVEDE